MEHKELTIKDISKALRDINKYLKKYEDKFTAPNGKVEGLCIYVAALEGITKKLKDIYEGRN